MNSQRPPRPMLLGINGKRRSGKNTAAEVIEEWCGDAFIAHSQGFADDLKKSGLASLGAFKYVLTEEVSMDQWMDMANDLKEEGFVSITIPGKADWTITGLEYWQFTGTEGHRDVFEPDFWVNNLLPVDEEKRYWKWCQADGCLTQLMMVTDVRFPNEAERIKELGGFVLNIQRPEAEVEVTHVSEQSLPPELVDEIIVNDSSLEDFKLKLYDFSRKRMFDGLKSGSGIWD